MFTLKLYRRVSHDAVITKIVTCHHVQTMSFEHADEELGTEVMHKALEVWAFDGPEPSRYQSFLIGEREKHECQTDHPKLRAANDWWGWGLLENENGRTTEHFRPASYG